MLKAISLRNFRGPILGIRTVSNNGNDDNANHRHKSSGLSLKTLAGIVGGFVALCSMAYAKRKLLNKDTIVIEPVVVDKCWNITSMWNQYFSDSFFTECHPISSYCDNRTLSFLKKHTSMALEKLTLEEMNDHLKHVLQNADPPYGPPRFTHTVVIVNEEQFYFDLVKSINHGKNYRDTKDVDTKEIITQFQYDVLQFIWNKKTKAYECHKVTGVHLLVKFERSKIKGWYDCPVHLIGLMLVNLSEGDPLYTGRIKDIPIYTITKIDQMTPSLQTTQQGQSKDSIIEKNESTSHPLPKGTEDSLIKKNESISNPVPESTGESIIVENVATSNPVPEPTGESIIVENVATSNPVPEVKGDSIIVENVATSNPVPEVKGDSLDPTREDISLTLPKNLEEDKLNKKIVTKSRKKRNKGKKKDKQEEDKQEEDKQEEDKQEEDKQEEDKQEEDFSNLQYGVPKIDIIREVNGETIAYLEANKTYEIVEILEEGERKGILTLYSEQLNTYIKTDLPDYKMWVVCDECKPKLMTILGNAEVKEPIQFIVTSKTTLQPRKYGQKTIDVDVGVTGVVTNVPIGKKLVSEGYVSVSINNERRIIHREDIAILCDKCLATSMKIKAAQA